ncbi:MAG: hypothetical protein PF961_23740 [Planctomycetota bacterium]|jgi:hypothetical protein|nr:hypothetical protein [Planctomycetota bacterium]
MPTSVAACGTKPALASLLVAAGLLTGCIEHRAAIDQSEPAATLVDVSGEYPTTGIERSSHLPQEIRATAWRRNDAGSIERAEIVAATALPWWQRFPADLVSDLLIPKTFIVEKRVTVSVAPLPSYTDAQLEHMARAHGYAGRAQNTP